MAQPQPEPKHTHPHRTAQPRVAGYKQSAHTSTHTPQHPSQKWRGASQAHTQTGHRRQEWRGTSGARRQTHTLPNTPARSGGEQPKFEPKHTHPHRTTHPGVAGCKQTAHTNTHTPQHPCQEWRGAAETRAQARTPTAHISARSGEVEKKRAHKHTHTPTREPGVPERSRNPSQNTHTHAADPGQEWRRTSGARTQTHTHPNTPTRSSGAHLKMEPKHIQRHRTSQPGVGGYKRSAHTSTHTPQHPSQEWRSAAATRAQAHTAKRDTPARSGGGQTERAHKHTHTPAPQPGVV